VSTVKSKKLQVGTDATATNNFTIYQPATPDGTLRIGVGNADSPTEVGQFNSNGYRPTTAPLFRAFKGNADQSLSSNVWTKITYSDVTFDTNSNFSTSTSRFTPTIAGYYQINLIVSAEGAVGLARCLGAIYKNGGTYSRLFDLQVTSGTIGRDFGNSDIVYFNGTTDYIEIYCYQIGTTPNLDSDPNGFQQVISGHLIQQA